MENGGIIFKFYQAFANHDATGMTACYHRDVIFSDPVFGHLAGNEAKDMWRMLIERSEGKLDVEFIVLDENKTNGSAKWTATYLFSKTNRRVVNHVNARFVIKDGLIINHTDSFNLWSWSRQAFGIKGLLFGWTNFMQGKIRQQAQKSLSNYRVNIS